MPSLVCCLLALPLSGILTESPTQVALLFRPLTSMAHYSLQFATYSILSLRSKGSPPDLLRIIIVHWAPFIEWIPIGLFAHPPGSHTRKCGMLNNIVNDPKAHAKSLASITLAFAIQRFPKFTATFIHCAVHRTPIRCSHDHPSPVAQGSTISGCYLASLTAPKCHSPHTHNTGLHQENMYGLDCARQCCQCSSAPAPSSVVLKALIKPTPGSQGLIA